MQFSHTHVWTGYSIYRFMLNTKYLKDLLRHFTQFGAHNWSQLIQANKTKKRLSISWYPIRTFVHGLERFFSLGWRHLHIRVLEQASNAVNKKRDKNQIKIYYACTQLYIVS